MTAAQRRSQKSKARRAARVAQRVARALHRVPPKPSRASGPIDASTLIPVAKFPVTVRESLALVPEAEREDFMTNALAVYPNG